MNAIKLAWLELRRFRGPLRRFVPLVLILVPLLYGALYLWATWDPYGKMDRVPVAVVNSDQPVEARGELINGGDQFVEQLRATGTFDWHFVNENEANRGLRDGSYYFTIAVPHDFSAKLATAGDTNPQRAPLEITKNDANGYIVGIMADTAESELQNQVNAAAHTSYARTLYGELDQIRDRLRTASEATGELVNGTELSEEGTRSLATGLNGALEGTGQISQGVETLAEASNQLDQQATRLTDATANELPSAVDSLVNATNVAVRSLDSVADTTSFIQPRAQESVAALENLGQRHPEITSDSTYNTALGRARDVAAAIDRADGEAQQGLGTARDAYQRATSLRDNMGQLQSQVQAIRDPVDTLTTGTAQLAGGTPGIVSGLQTLVSSNETLETGANQLGDGARRLDRLINDSLERIPPTNPTQVARAADVLGSPTTIQDENLNPAYVYGRGLAPFFFGIALWISSLFTYLLLKPVNERALADRTNALSIVLGGFLPAGVLGVAGGLALYAATDFGLGLSPEHAGGTIGLVSLATLAFVAVNHFLRVAFGAVGGLISLVLLVVQLTACGGLYPMETTPAPFQAIHPYLPMSYLVDGLRVTISGGMTERLLGDAIVLGCVLVAFLALSTLTVMRRRMWSVSRLHPQVEL